MQFGWINLFGAVIVALMLLPNIVYALRHKGETAACASRVMAILEQVGRYGCIVLMWLPLLVWEFGFSGKAGLLAYLFGNGALLVAYLLVWALYARHKTRAEAVALAVLPTCIFLLSGLLLRHWLLVGFAVLFGVGHIFVTLDTYRAE